MQNVMHISTNAGHSVQNDGRTMQNDGRNTLNVCQGLKGGEGLRSPTGTQGKKLKCLEMIFRTFRNKKPE